MTHKRKSKVCAQCFSWSDPKATIFFCWRAPSGSVHFPWRRDFKPYWSYTTKLRGEDRKELSPWNALSFEQKITQKKLQIAHQNLSDHFVIFTLMAQQWVLVETGCIHTEVLKITVVSGFVPAVTNGSILPWALSTERLIFCLFFKEYFSWMKNIFKDQEDHLLLVLLPFIAHSQRITSEQFFFLTLFLFQILILIFFSERFWNLA